MNFKSWVDRLSEWTVVGSYTRLGYERRAPGFEPQDLEVDLSGKVFVVSGANSGIGFATALGLAKRKATVVLLCRDQKRALLAAKAIRKELPSKAIRPEVCLADLSDLEQTRRAALEILSRHPAIHGLIHNAGNGLETRQLNAQGIEAMFATNVLSGFLLTQLFLPALRQAGTPAQPARVIWVSSGGMYTSGIEVSDLQWTRRRYDWLKVYAENKRALVVFAEEYAKAEPSPTKVIFHSMHPGWVNTGLVHAKLPKFEKVLGRMLRTPEQGADTVLWLAASSAAAKSSGNFWLDRKARRTVVLPGTGVSPGARARLFESCRALCGEYLRAGS